MSLARFRNRVNSAEEIAEHIGLPAELVIKKQLTALDKHMQSFIAQCPFLLLATVGRDGRCDVSPRGDAPPVAQVLDAQTLLIADRPGNRRADSLQNIVATGQVGLLFLLPGHGETLRVNGRACITKDEELLAEAEVAGRRPILGIGVEVEECYFHCAKALIRSGLWQHHPKHPDFHPRQFAQTLIEQTGAGGSVEALADQIDNSYRNRLY